MNVLFYTSGAIAIIAALMVITRGSAMHALVNLVVAFLAMACVFWTLGASFAAVLQIVVYAGAILVLFVFAVTIVNVGHAERAAPGSSWPIWLVPILLTAVLLAEFVFMLATGAEAPAGAEVGPAAVGRNLFTTYAIAIEIASVMLLAGLVAAFHLGMIPGRLGGRDE